MTRKACICLGCNREFTPKEVNRNKYCSRECCFKNKYKFHFLSTVHTNVKQLSFSVCDICLTLYVPNTRGSEQKYCSKSCSMESARRLSKLLSEAKHKPKIIECGYCKLVFTTTYGNKRQRFCSDECQDRHNKPISNRIGNHRRRVRIHSTEYERIDPFDIFEQCWWKCQLCQTQTPAHLRGTYKPNAPELDHIIPLALGGHHRRDNLQLLCRECNIRKGGRLIASR